jgi:hypothetical protein
MLISMVLIFGVSWLPLNIHNMIMDVYEPANHWPYAKAFFFLAHAAAMSSTCYNPFLYAWLNDNFRKEFKQVLPCFKTSQKRNSSKSYQKKSHFRSNQSQLLNLKDRGIRELSNRLRDDGNLECNGNHETIQLQDHNTLANDDDNFDDNDQQENQKPLKNNNVNNSLSNKKRNLCGRQGSIPEEEEEQEGDDHQEEGDDDETENQESDKTAIIAPSSSVPQKKDAAVYVRMESLSLTKKPPPSLTSREPSSTGKSDPSSSPVRSTESKAIPRTKNMATMTSMNSTSKSASSVYVPSTDSVKSKLTNNIAEDAL